MFWVESRVAPVNLGGGGGSTNCYWTSYLKSAKTECESPPQMNFPVKQKAYFIKIYRDHHSLVTILAIKYFLKFFNEIYLLDDLF